MDTFTASLTNVSKAIIIMLPIIVTFSLIVTSFINGDTKSLFFIFGALLLYGLNLFFVDFLVVKYGTIGDLTVAVDAPINTFLSKLFKWEGLGLKITPSFTVAFMSFVLMYLCLPLKNLPRDTEFPLLMVFVLVILTICSIFVSFNVLGAPTTPSNFGVHALAVAIGMGWGAAWFGIVKGKKDNPSGRTYFSANSADSVKCSRPSTQAFKCTVYKDGQPVGDINT
jgi:hypothetical protein